MLPSPWDPSELAVPSEKEITSSYDVKPSPSRFATAEDSANAKNGVQTSRPITAGSQSHPYLSPLHLLGFGTLLASDDFKYHFVTFAQSLEPFAKDGGMMHEYVLSRFLSDEAQALFVVPPLHFAFSHNFS
jgi:hypothetical protein